jgi:transcription factor TFIIIB component B''
VPAPADVHISTPNSPASTPEDQLSQVAATPAETHTSEQAQPTVETALEPATGSSQTAKPKRGRKRTTAAVTVEDAGEQEPPASRKRPRKRAAPLPGEEGYQPATRRETRSRKRSASAVENEEPEEDGEGNAGHNKKKPPRPQREATPPDAEAVEIDITQVKMADLAKDMHIGKKFSLHDELMERERAKRLRYNERRKRQQTGEEGDETAEADEAPNATPSSDLNSSAQPTPAAADDDSTAETPADSNARAPIGETYQIIDGEIVLDHRSLQVDRHARAREEAGDLVEIEENDFTHHTTSATYLRRNLKPQQWTDEETDLFYQALQAFGTDFDTICRMFRGKTRKHIKLKFNREERVNPQRITAALVGQKTVSFDMEQYQRATGQEYETAEAIYAEQKKAEEEFEARQKALEDEKAEEVRRKKEEVLAQLNSAVDGEGPKKGGRKGKKKKGPALMGL